MAAGLLFIQPSNLRANGLDKKKSIKREGCASIPTPQMMVAPQNSERVNLLKTSAKRLPKGSLEGARSEIPCDKVDTQQRSEPAVPEAGGLESGEGGSTSPGGKRLQSQRLKKFVVSSNKKVLVGSNLLPNQEGSKSHSGTFEVSSQTGFPEDQFSLPLVLSSRTRYRRITGLPGTTLAESLGNSAEVLSGEPQKILSRHDGGNLLCPEAPRVKRRALSQVGNSHHYSDEYVNAMANASQTLPLSYPEFSYSFEPPPMIGVNSGDSAHISHLVAKYSQPPPDQALWSPRVPMAPWEVNSCQAFGINHGSGLSFSKPGRRAYGDAYGNAFDYHQDQGEAVVEEKASGRAGRYAGIEATRPSDIDVDLKALGADSVPFLPSQWVDQTRAVDPSNQSSLLRQPDSFGEGSSLCLGEKGRNLQSFLDLADLDSASIGGVDDWLVSEPEGMDSNEALKQPDGLKALRSEKGDNFDSCKEELGDPPQTVPRVDTSESSTFTGAGDGAEAVDTRERCENEEMTVFSELRPFARSCSVDWLLTFMDANGASNAQLECAGIDNQIWAFDFADELDILGPVV